MCGPFVAFAVGQPNQSTSRATLQFAYHMGRLITYTLLGTAAGAAGALVDLTSTLAGVQPIAMALAGGMMIALGLAELLRYYGHRLPTIHPPAFLIKTVHRGQRLAMTLQPTRRALVIGLLTTLLPCGWLYAFAITAAGTGKPLLGALVMAVFWVGTLPVLMTIGVGVQAALGVFGKRLPVLCGIALVAVGLSTLMGRFALTPAALAQAVQHDASQRDVDGLASGAVPDPNQLPACCRETPTDPGQP